MATPFPPQGQFQDLPPQAQQRLDRSGDRRHAFTADLSVNEFLLIKDCGFDPMGLVMGCSIYHTGFQFGKIYQNQEMEVLSQALYHARSLAMSRMQEEAQLLQADGIVGVRLTVTRHFLGEGVMEFMAVGTAVKHRAGHNYRNAANLPFTSDLSGQDFRTLLHSGYRPLTMVMGNCVYHAAHQGLKQQWAQMGQNVELPQYTQAIYTARELALARLQAEAEVARSEGVIGADVQQSSFGWSPNVFEILAIGTAIVPTGGEHPIPTPQLVLSLNDSPRSLSVG